MEHLYALHTLTTIAIIIAASKLTVHELDRFPGYTPRPVAIRAAIIMTYLAVLVSATGWLIASTP